MSRLSTTKSGVVTDREFLSQRSVEVLTLNEISAMKDILRQALGDQKNCAGLAAIQVGFPVRMAIFKDAGKVKYLVNPTITERSGSQTNSEGCMSFPGMNLSVVRSKYITIESEGLVKFFHGFTAAVILHEIDHMNGITIIQRRKESRKAKRRNRK